MVGRVGHLPEDVPRRGPAAINALLLSLGIGLDFGLTTRPVKVEIRIEVFAIKRLDRIGVLGFDMQVAHVLAHHGAVLGFHQPVIIRVPRPRLRLFDEEFLSHPRHLVIDKLTAVVRMESFELKRKLRLSRFQQGFQPCFADVRDRPHHLPLCYFVHPIKVGIQGFKWVAGMRSSPPQWK